MPRDWRRVSISKRRPIHIETPLGIVNITPGLTDVRGRRVDSIEVIPSGDDNGRDTRYRSGYGNTRIIELHRERPENHQSARATAPHCGGCSGCSNDTPCCEHIEDLRR